MSISLCRHLKQDGVPCGSPALRSHKFCYFHQRDHKRSQYAAAAIRRADVLGPRLPRMRSIPQIRTALYEIVTALAAHRVSHQRAGARLFDLQQATAALRRRNSA